ncbi:MAG: hypothetical protein FIB05_06860 [Betaproteobacteria bacterium]|nr:hypothetical protein [Betaproteobacteria bacterium]
MTRTFLLLLVLGLPHVAQAVDLKRQESGSVLASPLGDCTCFVHEIEGTGARAVKMVGKHGKVRKLRDILEMGWVDGKLVAAVSPIYSRPGIYLWNCEDNSLRVLVPATNKNRAWPDGADFFRLLRVENGVLEYEHAPDVDSPTLEDDLTRNRKSVRINSIGKAVR